MPAREGDPEFGPERVCDVVDVVNAGGRRRGRPACGFRWKAILDAVITREVTPAAEGGGQVKSPD